MLVSVYRNFNEVIENLAFPVILEHIRDGKYTDQVSKLRNLLLSEGKEAYDKSKKSLPAFTPSATFKGGRKAELIDRYSGIIHLDFDKLSDEQLETAFNNANQLATTFACFRSPSGNGLKVFVKVNTGNDFHSIAYQQVQAYYEKELGILCDPKCKDVTRLCFVSDDKAAYLNNQSQLFIVGASNTDDLNLPDITSDPDYNALFEECIRYTDQKESYQNGSRNNYIYLLASNCNRRGIPEYLAGDLISGRYDLDIREISASIKSTYTHHSNEFANYANSAKSANLQTSLSSPEPTPDSGEVDYLLNTPIISDEIYAQLPRFLKVGAMAFTDHRERDVFLTGALAILSGCLPGVKGIYAQQTVYSNLFGFVIAPAASGKGALKFAKRLADRYHDSLLASSREALQHFEIEMNQYKARMRSKTDQDQAEDPPVQPPFKVVFIPANSSYAKILTHLQHSEGEGIICETEADTMGNVLKHDWGNYSDMLRKAFHHERVSSSKKTNNEYIEVNLPKLSVALSGTPNQVTGLIASTEDGLFSRFIFYVFKADLVWRDVSPYGNSINLTDHFNALSDEVFAMVQFLETSPTEINLTHPQWDDLNGSCRNWLSEITMFNGEDTASIIKRLGLIFYRITMVLSSLRKCDNGETAESIICSEQDFQSAKKLTEIYLQHSLLMFHNLPKQSETSTFKSSGNKRPFFESLPYQFKRAEAVELGIKFSLSARTVDNLLKELTGKYLSQPQYGSYQKM